MHIISEKTLNYDWAGSIVIIMAVFLAAAAFIWVLNKKDVFIALLAGAVIINSGVIAASILTERILPSGVKEYLVVFNTEIDMNEFLSQYDVINNTDIYYPDGGELKYIYTIREKK